VRVTNEQEVESFLRMAGRAAAVANATSDPWLKAEWTEIAGAYRDVAQGFGRKTASGRGDERGKGDG
jgi:hypothetical protein